MSIEKKSICNKEKKLLQKIDNRSDISSDELEKLLEYVGFKFMRQRGSHRTLRNEKTGKTQVIPQKKSVHKYLVSEVLKIYLEHKDLE